VETEDLEEKATTEETTDVPEKKGTDLQPADNETIVTADVVAVDMTNLNFPRQ
jgi:hypothetical protein